MAPPASARLCLCLCLCLAVAAWACAATKTTAPSGRNINGDYKIANAPKVNVSFTQRSGGKYFDVYSPVINSLYSQVNWDNHQVPVPADLVRKYDGKVISIVGYEFDIIRKVGGGGCVSSSSDNPVPCEYESVPGWEQYNHHYTNSLFGKGTKQIRTRIPGTSDRKAHTGHVEGWAVVQDPSERPADGLEGIAASQFLPMGNGAESRLTVKYFPPGYGALLYSPQSTSMNPMIIDTKARNFTPGLPHVPGRHGPVPHSSNVGPAAMYSGLMECPCTDLYGKKVATATTLDEGRCASHFASPAACFEAAASLGLVAKTNITVASAASPPGCFATAVTGGFEVAYNTNATSAAPCGSPGATPRTVALAEPPEATIHVEVDITPAAMPPSPSIAGAFQIAGPDDTGSLVTIVESNATAGVFTATCAGPKCFAAVTGKVVNGVWNGFSIPGTIRADNNQITWTNGVIFNRWWPNAVPEVDLAGSWLVTAGPSSDVGAAVQITGANSGLTFTSPLFPPVSAHVAANGTLVGFASNPGTISNGGNTIDFPANKVQFSRIDPQSHNGNVTITLTGPADKWFGAGFLTALPVPQPGSHTGSAMDGTYAIVVLGNGSVVERQLGHHEAGVVLRPSVTVVSETVVGGERTLVVRRPRRGADAAHFSFPAAAPSIGLITAVGASGVFGYHQAHSSTKLYFVEAGSPTCVCDGRPPLGSTSSQGMMGNFAFRSDCGPAPLGEMQYDAVWDNSTTNYTDNAGVNPTCEITAYRGGLKCCRGGTLLTDTAQARAALATENKTDYYQTLLRYYYEEVEDVSTVNDTLWTFWWTEFNNGEHDVPPCYNDECIDVITSNFTGKDMPGHRDDVDFALIHVEGHCHIGCQKMELWLMDDPAKPELICRTAIDYGTGDEPHNEMGYILGNQPCIFGHAKDGFEPPPVITSTSKLMSLKFQNNTVPRYGDMALWEIRASYL